MLTSIGILRNLSHSNGIQPEYRGLRNLCKIYGLSLVSVYKATQREREWEFKQHNNLYKEVLVFYDSYVLSSRSYAKESQTAQTQE